MPHTNDSKTTTSGSIVPRIHPYRWLPAQRCPTLPYKTHHRVVTVLERTWKWCRSCSPWQESEGRTETRVRHLRREPEPRRHGQEGLPELAIRVTE